MPTRFTFDGHTLDVALDHEQGAAALALLEMTLHLPETHRDDAAAATSEDESIRTAIVYDRDPGHAALETMVAPRRAAFHYTVIATIDGHEMHAHGVTGGETYLSWPTTLPPRPAFVQPTGEVVEMTLTGAVASDGAAKSAQ